MAIEDEFRRALAKRAALLFELASLALADAPGDQFTYADLESWEFSVLRGLLDDIEALGAAVCSRSGVSWDSMAAQYDVSRQALHRRLASRGDALWNDAQHDSRVDWRPWFAGRPAIQIALLEDRAAVHKRTAEIATQLTELRSTPGWWHDL